MKTVISLPDTVFRAAERLAKAGHKSRSQLFAEALREYLTRHAPDEVTATMDAVVGRLGDQAPDGFRYRAACRVFERAEW
ncbi:MAG: CopG family ribbon-helix-helix protein [Gemmatimonadales bacterium]